MIMTFLESELRDEVARVNRPKRRKVSTVLWRQVATVLGLVAALAIGGYKVNEWIKYESRIDAIMSRVMADEGAAMFLASIEWTEVTCKVDAPPVMRDIVNRYRKVRPDEYAAAYRRELDKLDNTFTTLLTPVICKAFEYKMNQFADEWARGPRG
jgi:hypothetical protein